MPAKRFLVKLEGAEPSSDRPQLARFAAAEADFRLTPLFEVASAPVDGMQAAAVPMAPRWYLAEPEGTAAARSLAGTSDWDLAHAMLDAGRGGGGLALGGGMPVVVEPDIKQPWPLLPESGAAPELPRLGAFGAAAEGPPDP
jgi:hypothetical protein